MQLVRFEFQTSRDIPFYAHLCNLLLGQEPGITIARSSKGYLIEAQGDQANLETLADKIANMFPLSVWLTDSSITLANERLGYDKPLKVDGELPDYCSHCYPRIGDNQSSEFGQILTPCPVCGGEQHWQSLNSGIDLASLKQQSRALLAGDSLTLSDGSVLSLTAGPELTALAGRANSLLVCNPNMLGRVFTLSTEQTLALCAIEKPLIRARARNDINEPNAPWPLPMYQLCFPWNRELICIAEILRQQNVTAVHITPGSPRIQLARVPGHNSTGWSEINTTASLCPPKKPEFIGAPEPLYDSAEMLCIEAHWHKGKRHLGNISFTAKQHEHLSAIATSSEAEQLAQCALNAAMLEADSLNLKIILPLQAKQPHIAALHFSSICEGKMLHTDKEGQIHTFLSLPTLPARGADIIAQLNKGEQVQVTAKFTETWPEVMARLQALDTSAYAGTLTGLFAICALLLELDLLGDKARTQDHQILAQALEAAALSMPGRRAPRIDYPLIKQGEGLTLDWKRTLGSLMAFRLAEPDDAGKIAFGVFDSLADYLANWVEHLDNKQGIAAVALCGDEMANECLNQRLAIRIGKNFPLLVNRKLAIAGNNYAAGALYLKRRRFGLRA
ncbi:hypothetical protein L2750_18920 [Shewanella submarina]|uniref:Carbamoyltransferase Kae1-like domain-containing protein n=1 Tax=Shewanella submarina TaxID=2016376 RepID=A0ABV7GI92_9GAMM|nr:hypothetical protein [Shewanella submarina]MCL1039199.1 hypothetical protein [Shewanella submarina]